jgi:hypothetical protein
MDPGARRTPHAPERFDRAGFTNGPGVEFAPARTSYTKTDAIKTHDGSREP